ncbi:ABC transporter ATP-binding protein [Alkalicoccus daliensis]|uniref:ABC-2 type transport system ATP-binding protein n=1 Tax=Alkalicoccus daliensis TaxID=745820 RepID=A0A1H0KFC4_9BACI|nr:ABC transporter ATP-binding protein [Alkalicoccus daliensis]SDO54503.1 ABC-2 type transport system ATP-binding protein [Alkalicoccus daliensis]
MQNIISVKNLTKYFGKEKALEGMNFDVKQGEIFGFLGPSGAGKTTTIQILTGQLRPTDGEAKIFNADTENARKPEFLQKIGVMTDNSGLYGRLSVYENMKLFATLYGVKKPKERIEEALKMVNMQNEQKKTVSKLSKGMTQRIILARTFLHEPELLFLDEPTAALDPVNSQHIHKGLKALQKKGTTIFLTTHDMHEAETLCDRVAFLYKGAVKLLDAPKALRREYADNTMTLELYNGETRVISKGADGAEEVASFMQKNAIASMYTNEPTLGDIFVDITGRELT